jgi:sucrose phosphorylase
MAHTGELRDINRSYYSLEGVERAVQQPVVQRLLALMRFRNRHPAFDGSFELLYSNDSSVAMAWRCGEHFCELFVDLNFKTSTITCSDEDSLAAISFRA